MKKWIASVVWMLISISLPSQEWSKSIAFLDTYIEKAREQWNVPGLAVSVVKDGQVLLMKGYGHRNIEQSHAIDAETLFAICSTTKAMTAAAMAMLVDDGKLHWDDPVVEHLPTFQLKDPYASRSIRVRDLFTHNTGLGNADLLWYMWQNDPSEIMEKLRQMDLSYPLRGGYTYQNLMYAVAGQIIEKVSGSPWEDFVSTNIFNPLGMENTFATQARSSEYPNRSTPHYPIGEEIVSIKNGNADPIAPAGAVWSTIADMTKWMLFVLDSARIGNDRLISETNYREWLAPQTIVSDSGFYPTQELTKPNWKTYALGWFQHDYRGRKVNFHTGSLQGTIAIIGIMPEENLGVYVFGNLDHAEVRHAIMYKVFDMFGLADTGRDWSTDIHRLYQGKKNANEQSDPAFLAPPLPLAQYQGNYSNSFLGEIAVTLHGDELSADIDGQKMQLLPKYLNTFSVVFINRPWIENIDIHFQALANGIHTLKIFDREFKKIIPQEVEDN